MQLETEETKIQLSHNPKPVFFKPLGYLSQTHHIYFYIYFITLFYLILDYSKNASS